MKQEVAFQSLMIITIIAFFLPLLVSLSKTFRIPIVVGEIICGIIIGKSGLNLIESGPWLDFLATFGFTYLMFISGLEVDFGIITNLPRRGGDRLKFLYTPLGMSLMVFLVTFVLSLGISGYLVYCNLAKNIWIMALILSTTSVGVVVPVLKEKGVSSNFFGQSILICAMVADFITMCLITVIVAVMSKGITLDIFIVLILFVAFFVVYRLGLFFARYEFLKKLITELAHATSQIRVRGAFALILGFIVLSQKIGVELILGAFLAGAIISLLSKIEGSELRMKLDAIGFGFFIPIFFIMVGVDFDLSALILIPKLLLPLLIISAYLVKVVPALFLKMRFTFREAVSSGFLLSSRLSLIIAAGAIGLKMGMITDATYSAIILVAIVTSTLSPIIFDKIYVSPSPSKEPSRVVIVGADENACLLAKRLIDANVDVAIMDKDESRCKMARKLGLEVFQGDATVFEELLVAMGDSGRALIAMTDDDRINIQACNLARSMFGVKTLLSKLNNTQNQGYMAELGIQAFSPELSMVIMLDNFLRNPSTFSLMADKEADKSILELELTSREYIGRAIKEVNIPGDCLILSINRDGEFIVPHGNTVLEKMDIITVIGSNNALAELTKMVAS